jgi:PAS domain S-box-containing protein
MQGVHILLVEPDPAARRQVGGALRAAGHMVLEVADAEAALSHLRGERFAMVVVAAEDPAGAAGPSSAIAIAERARGGSRGSPVVILFLAHPAAVPALRPLLASPLTDCIVKPMEQASLEARLAVAARLISERGDGEDARELREERFRTLYAESPIGILLYDHAGDPVEMNPAAKRIFGVQTLEQIPNMFDCFRIFPEPSAGAAARERLSRGDTFRHEFPVNFEHGINDLKLPPTSRTGIIYIDLLMTPVAVQGGGPPGGYLVQVQDVTDRRLAEQSLELAYRSVRKVLDSLPECIAVHQGGSLLYVNAQGLSAFGYAGLDEVVGKPLLEFLRPHDAEAAAKCLEELAAAAGAGRAITRELRITSPKGEAALLEVTGGPPIEYEGVKASLVLARDVSEKKRLESRLVVADRMASLGTLAAGVAHEINNPLSYVMANVSHVSTEIARRGDEVKEVAGARSSRGATDALSDIREALDEALVGVDRIRRIVADLKTFSRPDDERLGAVDIRRVLDSSVNMAANEVRHRARLIKEYGVVPFVRGSEARLGQVFLNLLVNAAQALPVGQASHNEIRLRTLEGAGGRVIVEVSDTGPGIPDDVLRRIFDPFFTTKPVGEGTGLGLAICHAIVKALGGDISVDSVVGAGTRVRVALPAAAPIDPRHRRRAPLRVGRPAHAPERARRDARRERPRGGGHDPRPRFRPRALRPDDAGGERHGRVQRGPARQAWRRGQDGLHDGRGLHPGCAAVPRERPERAPRQTVHEG